MPELAEQPESPSPLSKSSLRRWLLMAALPVLLHVATVPPDEPVFNGDANRHVMTSVFFRDFLVDLPLDQPKEYAESYYEQYPALGLMVWPPLFHGVVGCLMTVFGTSATVPRIFVFVCFALATLCLYRICRRRMSAAQSELVIVIFSLMPMVYEFSRFVMLEMPTLALCLVSIERFDLWLCEQKHRNLYFAAIAAALASLTRFDAAVLLPTLLFVALFAGHWKRLLSWHLPLAAFLAIAIMGPTYLVIWRETGDLHLRQAAESVSGTTSQMFAPGSWYFYPSCIAGQAGWFTVAFLIVGLLCSSTKMHRSTAAIFAALLLGTYVTFTPLAELRDRHSIYWLPAVAYFASVGAVSMAALLQRMTTWTAERSAFLAYAFVVCGTASTTFFLTPYRVTGYAEAATVILDHSEPESRVFVDAWWDGNMTYQLRHLDPDRSRHVVRADKELFDFINVPTVDFQQFVETDHDILQAIHQSNARCLVFEDPQPFGHIPISQRMHDVVESLPSEFRLLRSIPVQSTFPGARSFRLKIFTVDQPALAVWLESRQDTVSRVATRNEPAIAPAPSPSLIP